MRPKKAKAKADDFKGLARELWSELTAREDKDIDQALKRAVHEHKGDDKALYLALTSMLGAENQKGE